nr:4-hydroxyphenylpyruvate dioxygenase and related hemolysins [Klebsiella pneumoniae]
MEIFENDLLYYTGTPAEIRQLAADLGLKITLFNPFAILKAQVGRSLRRIWPALGASLL